MKKAKRLLAIILAVIMIASAAGVPVYARKGGQGGSSDYRISDTDSADKYYFTAEKGATYVLDLLDEMLREANLVLYLSDKDPGGLIPNALLPALNLKVWGDWRDYGEDGVVYLTSIDNAILELDQLLSLLDTAGAVDLLSPLLGDITDLLGSHNSLSTQTLRGNPDLNYQNGSDDIDVLFNVLNWVYSLKGALVSIVRGEFSLGSIIEGLLSADILKIVKQLPEFLKDTVYSALVDSSATARPAGMTMDAAIQKVIDWALISGTGVTPETGANSILGENMEPFLPAIGEEPGAASIDARTIQADRNGDGVPETHTMGFYQLVNNAIQALLNGMLKDLLTDVLYDALDVDPAVNDGKGDPALMTDVMFNTIVGAVESLCVQNGAPPVVYTEDAQSYPVPKINCLLDWFFMPNGGLATLIRFDYTGVHITDNFMSLLNDIARLAPGLLGGLLEMELPESIVYSADELNEIKWVNSNYQLCDADDPDAMEPAYLSYEKDGNGNQYKLFVSEYRVENDVRVPVSYSYVGSGALANTTQPSAANYINPTFIRSDFVITTSQVWACLLKILLNDLIEGCYFPEWADSVASAGAYALASMAAVLIPEENFIERLDAYHYEQIGESYEWINKDLEFDPLPYEELKSDPTGKTPDVVIPKAALDIGSSIGAFYLNGIFDFKGRTLTVHNTSFERLMVEFLIWGFVTYLPVLAGNFNTSTGRFEGGTFSTPVNALIDECYADANNNVFKNNANFNVIYSCIDNTLFKFLPADWLPEDFASSFGFLNGWLVNSVKDLNIQKIFSILSVNPEGELNKSVANVLINIVARTLGIIFGGRSLLQTGTGTELLSSNPTVVTSFEALLSKDSLAALVGNLLDAIMDKGRILFNTVFPFLLSTNFLPKYDESLLGTNMTTYKIADLQNYVDYIGKNVNGVKQFGDVFFDKEKTAKSAAETLGLGADGYTVVPQEDNTVLYKVVFPESYEKELDATRAARFFDNGYASAYEENGVTRYNVYSSRDYLLSATRSEDLTDDAGIYHTYSNFNYAELVDDPSTPFAQYDDNFRFFEAEDFSSQLFTFNNFENEIEKASDFIGDYKELATSTLPNAYATWARYSIQSRLSALNLYDTNGDGAPEMYDSNNDGTPDTPIRPSIPSAIYPFKTGTSAEWSYYDQKNQGIIGRRTTVNKNEFNESNYEVLAMAIEYANNPENVVVLPDNQAEEIVRLALQTLTFDITPNADNTYNANSRQWENLSSTEINSISNFCTANGYTLVNTDGVYTITRKPFDFITSSWSFGVDGVNINPVIETQNDNEVQKINKAITEAYDEYVFTMRQNRLLLYNHLNEINYRINACESHRNTALNFAALNWVVTFTRPTYIDTISNKRNKQLVGFANGEEVYSKIYTSASYQKFQEAYDFAKSVLAKKGEAAAANGLTQSIISKAYMGLLKAFQALAAFSGEADWTQLDKYLALAESLITGIDPDTQDVYIPDTFINLITAYTNADEIREHSGYDCESQDIIDSEVDDLFRAISSLKYLVDANIVPADNSNIQFVVTSGFEQGERKIGQVFNLEEGIGLTKELVKLVGMYEDYESGKTMEVKPSSHGNGTGAYYQAYDGQYQKFYYVAVLFGDINGDTRIDGTDKSIVNYYIITGDNTREGMGDNAKFEAADVNHDGQVTEADSKLIEEHYNYTSIISQSGHSSVN